MSVYNFLPSDCCFPFLTDHCVFKAVPFLDLPSTEENGVPASTRSRGSSLSVLCENVVSKYCIIYL
jgi:hypothetical protein